MLVIEAFNLVCIIGHIIVTDNLLTVQSLLVEDIAIHCQHILDLSVTCNKIH